MRILRVPIVVLLAWGCQPRPQYQVPATAPRTTPGPSDTGTATGTPAGTPTPTGPTGCNPNTPTVLDARPLTWAGEEFAFDRHGNFVTVSDWAGAAWHMDYAGNWTNLAPFASPEVAGVDFLADGTLAVADEGNGAIMAIDEAGSSWLIKGGVDSPNSLALGPDGMLYVSAYDNILRIHPETGISEDLGAFGGDLDGLVFTADGQNLFFNVDAAGEVWRMGFDAEYNVVDTVLVHDIGGGWGAELDGMASDVCNNIYVLAVNGMVHRIGPGGGLHEDWVDLPGNPYSTALHFGSGVGGWEKDHLYVQDRNGQLYDIDVGIEGTQEPHL